MEEYLLKQNLVDIKMVVLLVFFLRDTFDLVFKVQTWDLFFEIEVMKVIFLETILHPASSSAPSTASSNGTAGTIAYDSNYIYICIATNTWKRVAIGSW